MKDGFKGVYKKGSRYEVAIKFDDKKIYGGLFTSAVEAAKKYNELAVKYHGDNAQLNKISI